MAARKKGRNRNRTVAEPMLEACRSGLDSVLDTLQSLITCARCEQRVNYVARESIWNRDVVLFHVLCHGDSSTIEIPYSDIINRPTRASGIREWALQHMIAFRESSQQPRNESHIPEAAVGFYRGGDRLFHIAEGDIQRDPYDHAPLLSYEEDEEDPRFYGRRERSANEAPVSMTSLEAPAPVPPQVPRVLLHGTPYTVDDFSNEITRARNLVSGLRVTYIFVEEEFFRGLCDLVSICQANGFPTGSFRTSHGNAQLNWQSIHLGRTSENIGGVLDLYTLDISAIPFHYMNEAGTIMQFTPPWVQVTNTRVPLTQAQTRTADSEPSRRILLLPERKEIDDGST